jgi:hypothetical protein
MSEFSNPEPTCPVCAGASFDATGNCLNCNPVVETGAGVPIFASPMVPIRCTECGCEDAQAYT